MVLAVVDEIVAQAGDGLEVGLVDLLREGAAVLAEEFAALIVISIAICRVDVVLTYLSFYVSGKQRLLLLLCGRLSSFHAQSFALLWPAWPWTHSFALLKYLYVGCQALCFAAHAGGVMWFLYFVGLFDIHLLLEGGSVLHLGVFVDSPSNVHLVDYIMIVVSLVNVDFEAIFIVGPG